MMKLGDVLVREVRTEVTHEVDVLVCGGGTAGCLAAVAAARTGAKVLLLERRHYLGGMLTGGNAGLTMYTCHAPTQEGYREITKTLRSDPAAVQIVGGLPMELTRRLLEDGIGIGTAGTAGAYVFTDQARFKSYLLNWLREEGVELLFHAPVSDVLKEGNRLTGVVYESKQGSRAVAAGVTIDATGDGDIAARAGVPFHVGVTPMDEAARDKQAALGAMSPLGFLFRMAGIDMRRCFAWLREHPEHFRVQRFSQMTLEDAADAFEAGEMSTLLIRGIGHGFQIYNTPQEGVFIFCCPMMDGNGLDESVLTEAEVALDAEVRKRINDMRTRLPGFEKAWLVDCPEVWTRESRHFEGEYTLGIREILDTKSFPDSIGRGGHPIDIRPAPDWIREYPIREGWYFHIPYRCLVPKAIDQLLLAGRNIAATHEANGCTRPTAQCMIIGEAAGTAAALSLRRGETPRDLCVKDLCHLLEKNGVLL